jgi:hypothetical protein
VAWCYILYLQVCGRTHVDCFIVGICVDAFSAVCGRESQCHCYLQILSLFIHVLICSCLCMYLGVFAKVCVCVCVSMRVHMSVHELASVHYCV